MRPPLRPLGATLSAGMLLALGPGCASIRSGVQAAYNDDMVDRVADPLEGNRWVTADGARPVTAYSGRHTVLVFFDPGAGASADVMESVAELHTEFAPTGVAFLGITDADAERLRFFTDDHPIPFPVLTESPEDRLNFRIKKLFEPEVLLVDPYGRILADGIGDARGILRQKR